MDFQEPLIRVDATALADHEVLTVKRRILELDPDGTRLSRAIRRTFDMLLDGVHTGRYRWEQLHKTEKTHCGTLVEINLQRELKFDDGVLLDYNIAGVEVDCKYSQDDWRWMIPPEAVGHVLLVVWANDLLGRFKAGLVRAIPELLGNTGNRDGKKSLTVLGRRKVEPLFDGSIPENVLLHLPPADQAAIFTLHTGQQRINELFRRVQGKIVTRNIIATVAQQDDYMKRLRYNGGARSALKPAGIVILGQYESHRKVAAQLAIPVPGPGDSIAVRLARRTSHHQGLASTILENVEWVVAQPVDPPEEAPKLPATKRGADSLDDL